MNGVEEIRHAATHVSRLDVSVSAPVIDDLCNRLIAAQDDLWQLQELAVDLWDSYGPEDMSKLTKLEQKRYAMVEQCRRESAAFIGRYGG
jgi:hypothetical protein